MEELKIIKVGKDQYLGLLNEQGKVSDCFSFEGELDKETLKEYIMAKNVGRLDKIGMSAAKGYFYEELKEEDKIRYELLETIFKRAQKEAIKHLENTVFSELVNEQG